MYILDLVTSAAENELLRQENNEFIYEAENPITQAIKSHPVLAATITTCVAGLFVSYITRQNNSKKENIAPFFTIKN